MRWIAEKLLIVDALKREEGRVRILGTVVSKYIGDNYGFIVVDDGTETIRVRCFKEDTSKLNDVQEGDIVDVIGRIRKYEDEVYIVPEGIVKLADPNWEFLRKIEIFVLQKGVKSEVPEQTNVSKDADKIVLEAIQKLDKEEGVSLDEIASYTKLDRKEVEEAIEKLMASGEIFEPKPERYKIL